MLLALRTGPSELEQAGGLEATVVVLAEIVPHRFMEYNWGLNGGTGVSLSGIEYR
jgi:hypothetical protein